MFTHSLHHECSEFQSKSSPLYDFFFFVLSVTVRSQLGLCYFIILLLSLLCVNVNIADMQEFICSLIIFSVQPDCF